MLKAYKVKPRTVRRGTETEKGYKLEWLSAPFAAYLPPRSVTASQPSIPAGFGADRSATPALGATPDVTDPRCKITSVSANCDAVTLPEFIRFLNAIEAEVPAGKIVHVILDNYGPHKHPETRAWLDRHPRFTFHYTPTSGSWLNAVEGFFAKLTRRRLKRGVFCSIVDLQAAINRFLADTNADP